MRSAALLGLLLALAPIALLASESVEERVARYQQFAGEPVPDVRQFQLYRSDILPPNHVVVWGKPGQVYLLSLRPECSELKWADVIGLSSALGTVKAGVDYIRARGQRCYIDQIRPIDERAMKDAKKAQKG